MYKLCDLHLSVENYTEAGFTLLRRADDLKVRNGHSNYTTRTRVIIGFFDYVAQLCLSDPQVSCLFVNSTAVC